MPTKEFILILKMCFSTVGLNPVVRSPIRLEVLEARGRRVGEVYLINDTIDGLVFISDNEYGDLFEGVITGLRAGWKVAKGELPIEA